MQILPLQVLLPLTFNILKGTNPGNLLSTTCWVKMEQWERKVMLVQQKNKMSEDKISVKFTPLTFGFKRIRASL